MKSNPYQSPAIESRNPRCDAAVDDTGIPHNGFLKFRRAGVFLTATMAGFFLLACVQMVQDSMFVDAAIASIFWIGLLVCIGGMLRNRTATEAKLTLTKYRAISSSMRPLCLWLSPLMVAIGGAQVLYVPVAWQFNPYGFLICGLATFGCAFSWPQPGH